MQSILTGLKCHSIEAQINPTLHVCKQLKNMQHRPFYACMCDQHEIPVYHVRQQSNSDFPMYYLE